MLLQMKEPDFIFENASGCLVQLVREGFRQINVITSVAGSKRGGHFHKINKEAFYVISGGFKLLLEEDGIQEEYRLKAGDMFLIEPYQKHYFEYTEDTVLVSMYDKGVELPRNGKDIYTE